jgi:tRNA(Ile)-lysidine synthase
MLRFGASVQTPMAAKRPDTDITKNRAKRSTLAQTILGVIRRGFYGRPLFRPGDRIGIAVSGGADSVALLHLLLKLQRQLGVLLSVAHFNHQLRGKASDDDEKFVSKLAERYGLEFHVGRANVASKAKQQKLNLEDAARRARYGFFSELVKEGKVTQVAVAHTADDQAETVLAHILRGTGLAGLGGIHPVSQHIVRPMLEIRRAALRVYLKEQKQPWREDATNRDTAKLRARIRKKLLPMVEKHFQPSTVEHLSALAQFAREDEARLEFTAEMRARILSKKTDGTIRIHVRELQCLPKRGKIKSSDVDPLLKLRTRSLTRRMVRHIVKQVKTRAGELGAWHVEAVLDLAERAESGKLLQLPGGVEVRRERDSLVFRAVGQSRETNAARTTGKQRPRGAPKPGKEFEYSIDFSGSDTAIEVPCLACIFRFTRIDWPAKRGETSSMGPVLDERALRLPLVLRNWRPGDRFRPAGHRKAHKLKRLLYEKRVSRWEREGWPVLTSAGVLAWVRGFPLAAEFAVNEVTQAGIAIAEEEIA